MGKFRAQEYNSVMTQTPAVMQAIARGLGVTMGELKTMSDKGKRLIGLFSRSVIRADLICFEGKCFITLIMVKITLKMI